MHAASKSILKAISGKSKIRFFTGVLQSVTTTGFVVIIGTHAVPCLPSDYLPAVGDTVRVWVVDGVPYLMGPLNPNPSVGTVVSVASGYVTLSTTAGTVVAPYSSTLTPTAGQVMRLVWSGGPFALAVASAASTTNPTPSVPTYMTTVHTDTFSALDSGSNESGRWWTPEVWASTNNLGAWFYGSKIANTIPSTATNMSIQIWIAAKQIYGYAPNFCLHGYQTKPTGAPTLGATTAVAVQPGWVTLPASYAAALANGGGSFGIGVAHGGYNIFNSLAEDGESGALQIISTY